MNQHPAWLFNELQNFGWSDLSAIAAYEKKARVDPASERERLLSLGVSPAHTLIDFGCGTGTLALEAAKLCRRVVAVDVSAAMLTYVQRKAERLGIDNLDCVHQGFLTYEHQGASADVIVAQRALHHLPDFWKVQALQRIARTLKPGGVLFVNDLFYSFIPDEADEALEGWMDEVAVEADDGFSRAFFEHDIREEFITYTWLFEAMLTQTGFSVGSSWFSELKTYARYICVKAHV